MNRLSVNLVRRITYSYEQWVGINDVFGIEKNGIVFQQDKVVADREMNG